MSLTESDDPIYRELVSLDCDANFRPVELCTLATTQYPTTSEVVCFLRELAQRLDETPRHGSLVDLPEGTRFLQLSDTLAQQLSRYLADIATTLKGHA